MELNQESLIFDDRWYWFAKTSSTTIDLVSITIPNGIPIRRKIDDAQKKNKLPS